VVFETVLASTSNLLYLVYHCYLMPVTKMSDKSLIVLVAALLPSLALAQDPQNYQCTHGDLQRRIEILYEPGMAVPCEVHYFKDTEAPGERQVLWRALNEQGYCERKTAEFISKLKGLGWNCTEGGEAPAEMAVEPATDATPATEPVDDTETLMPAEETGSTED